MSYKIQEAFEEVIIHWHKTIPALLYSMLIGILIIALIWVDKLLQTKLFLVETSLGNAPKLLLFIGGIFLIVPILGLLFYRCWLTLKIIFLRNKYSVLKHPERYSLIDFAGKVYLLDKNEKIMYWIQTWQTAVDLKLTDSWTRSGISLDEPGIFSTQSKSFETIYGDNIKINEYKKGLPIFTQDSYQMK